MSKDLRRRGWSFVGPTTVYSFMEAMGLVNDHLVGCAFREPVEEERRAFKRPKGSGLALGPALGSGPGRGARGKGVGRLAGEERRPIGELGGGSALRAVSPAAHGRLVKDLEAGMRFDRPLGVRRDGGATTPCRGWGSAARAGSGHLAVGAGPARGAVLSGESVDAIGRHGAPIRCVVYMVRAFARFEVSSRKRVRLALRSAPRWSPPPRSRFTFALTGPRLCGRAPPGASFLVFL